MEITAALMGPGPLLVAKFWNDSGCFVRRCMLACEGELPILEAASKAITYTCSFVRLRVILFMLSEVWLVFTHAQVISCI